MRLIIQKFAIYILLILPLFLNQTRVLADESLHIAGMGGAFAGLQSFEGGIFGNPAGLIDIHDNNLSVSLSAQNLDYGELPKTEDEQLSTQISLRLSPSIYYSRVIGGVGVGLGYVDDLDSNSIIKIMATEAGYIVDERKFTSDTDTLLEYDLFRSREAVVSLGYPVKPDISIGVRMKYRSRTLKEGIIYRSLNLTSVHGEDVNRNDPAKLLPAVIDNLDIDDAINNFRSGEDSYEDVIADLSGSGLDFDLGMQARIFPARDISVGFMLEHLIQHRIVRPQPAGIRLGVGAMPIKWATAAVDLHKALDKSGLNVNLGWEIRHRWERWFYGGIMIRNGFSHESSNQTKNRISVGISLILGESHWDYTLVKPLDDSPLSQALHMFSSSVRF